MIIIYYFSDRDECLTNTHNRDVNAYCTNSNGTFDCTCNEGFKGNGMICTGMHLYSFSS